MDIDSELPLQSSPDPLGADVNNSLNSAHKRQKLLSESTLSIPPLKEPNYLQLQDTC